ncbi:hypothetical protein LCGC14_0376350 [marine sediment metagenome]|uniref:Uncharacterized protein n=1 Tax=marine sediment metagenome TaxID=412755 RepID=A0A0F9TLZ4_9ZZZZ
MNLMEFLIALKDTEGTSWSDDDIKRWTKELFRLQAKLEVAEEDVARVERNYKNRCEITEDLKAQLSDLKGENEKLKDEELRLLRRIEQLIIEKYTLEEYKRKQEKLDEANFEVLKQLAQENKE